MTSTLLERPQLATYIAGYISLWNGAETLIAGIVEKLFGPSHADMLLGHIQSISTRMDIVDDLLKHRKDAVPWANDALTCLKELRAANSYRSKLVHGLYSETEDCTGVLLVGNLFDRRRAFRQEEITAESVLAEYRKLERTMLDLIEISKHPPSAHGFATAGP